jgi:toxin-antitoxin system PIN domain toxin
MTSSVFPDINVWVALTYPDHLHHGRATAWLSALSEDVRLVFCRHTQLGLFRLLTTEAVLGRNVRTQLECWSIYDRWIGGGKAALVADNMGLDAHFRRRAAGDSASPKVWADAYLAAFAEAGGLTLITIDKALASKSTRSVLLG